MKKHLLWAAPLALLLTATGCGKDGDDTPAPPPTTFSIANLQYDPSTAIVKAQQPSLPINGTVTYKDAQNGVAQLRMKTSAGADLTVPVQGVTAASGTVAGSFQVAMPARAGAYSFELWLVDGRGASSNKLTGSLTMTVNDAATTWEMISQQHTLHKVTWAANKYLAVGENGKILSSPNGGNWTQHPSGTTNTLYGVCWTGTQYVAVGQHHTILTSPDGTSWTPRTSFVQGVHLNGVASSGSGLVAVGWNAPKNSTEIKTSTDGITWTSNAFAVTGGELTGLTWSGSQYVAVGKAFGYPLILTSPNGTTWTNRSGIEDVPGQLADVVWSGSQYVATGYSAMATSADGLTWKLYKNPSFSAAGITWSGSRFVAAGIGGIDSSADGVTWSKAFDVPHTLRSVTWSGFQYVAVGSSALMVSP
jgi:hypothetical protein